MSRGSRIPRSPRRCISSWAPSSRACTGRGFSYKGAWPTTCEHAPRGTLMITKHRRHVLEPRTQAFIDAVSARGSKPINELSYGEAREFLEDAQAGATTLPADVEETVLPTGPTGAVAVRIYRPKGTQGPLPVVMYFHGGGWVLGSKHTHDRLLRDLVNGSHAAFVFVSYTPSPEGQFPVPIEQAYAATAYIAE